MVRHGAPGSSLASVRYAILRHKHSVDRPSLSGWLRTHQYAMVNFVTKDGMPHQGILTRLKHCFGRGLLLYTDPVDLKEKGVIQLELPGQKTK